MPSIFSGCSFKNYDNLSDIFYVSKIFINCLVLFQCLKIGSDLYVHHHIRRIIQLRFENQQVRDLVPKLLLYYTFKNASAIVMAFVLQIL